MKIRSKIDVITNSSTEVFILQDSRNFSEVNKELQQLGYQGEVFKLTKELYQEKRNTGNICQLSNIFVDKENHNYAWFYLYRSHVFNPVKETPEIIEGIEYYDSLPYNKETELQRKIKSELLDTLAEENKSLKRFSEYLKSGNIHDFPEFELSCNPEIKEKFKEWIENNIHEFPEYQTLLKMYDFYDMSEVIGNWIDFFDDDCISPEKYLGDVYMNENINYSLTRLS